MPAQLPDGLSIAAVLPREDPCDAVVLPSGTAAVNSIDALVKILGETPSIGTGSVRRVAQLRRAMPGAHFTPIRGNLDTRLRKLDAGEHDALVLATAGLHRLGFRSRVSFRMPPHLCIPAPGQGIVAVETRQYDEETRRAVARVGDARAASELAAERAVVEGLGGGCQTPLGALACCDGNEIRVEAVVIALDGSRAIRSAGRGPLRDAAAVGASVAAKLLADGAGEILDESRRAQAVVEGLQP
jgi:hydroxymethylbilane synthase